MTSHIAFFKFFGVFPLVRRTRRAFPHEHSIYLHWRRKPRGNSDRHVARSVVFRSKAGLRGWCVGWRDQRKLFRRRSERGRHRTFPLAWRAPIEANLPYKQLQDAQIPLNIMATNQQGLGIRLSSGPAVEAILASTAIPGVFPPVPICGDILMDGATQELAPHRH